MIQTLPTLQRRRRTHRVTSTPLTDTQLYRALAYYQANWKQVNAAMFLSKPLCPTLFERNVPQHWGGGQWVWLNNLLPAGLVQTGGVV